MRSFEIDGMTLRPCYNGQLEEYGGCLDESDEFQACDECSYYGRCPLTGGDEEE